MADANGAPQEYWQVPIVNGGASLPFGHINITYQELFETYAEGEFGQHHANQALRWDQYGVSELGLSDAIGADAHPLGHMIVTHNIAVEVAEREIRDMSHLQLADNETALLRTATLLHDIGENTHPELAKTCGVVGDIPFGLKTDEQRATEAAVRDVFWKHKFGFLLPKDFRDKTEQIIDHSGSRHVVKTAQAAHTFGAFQSAVFAFNASERTGDFSQSDRVCLRELAFDAARQLARKALPEAVKFSYVREMVPTIGGELQEALGQPLVPEKAPRIHRV